MKIVREQKNVDIAKVNVFYCTNVPDIYFELDIQSFTYKSYTQLKLILSIKLQNIHACSNDSEKYLCMFNINSITSTSRSLKHILIKSNTQYKKFMTN